MWKGINEIIKNSKKSEITEIFLNENGNIFTDNEVVANKFNTYFTNIADDLLKNIAQPNTKYQDYLKKTLMCILSS